MINKHCAPNHPYPAIPFGRDIVCVKLAGVAVSVCNTEHVSVGPGCEKYGRKINIEIK